MSQEIVYEVGFNTESESVGVADIATIGTLVPSWVEGKSLADVFAHLAHMQPGDIAVVRAHPKKD